MRDRFPRLLFVTVCGLAPTTLGSLLDWSPLLWGFMSMVTVSGSLLLILALRSSGREPAQLNEHEEPQPSAPPEQPYQETRVSEAALPSARDGYDFLFSATVWWRPVPGHADWSGSASPALAVSAVINRASAVVRHEDPARASFARYLLEGELGIPFTDRSGWVESMLADVTLTLAPADRDRLRKLSDLRKDEEVWEHERQHERSKRQYLGEDVLKSTGSAVVWWLARHEEEIEKAVDMIGPLAQISAAAKDEEVPDLFRHLLVPPVGARTEATVGGPPWDGSVYENGIPDREEEVSIAERLRLLLGAVGLKPDMDAYTVMVHRVVVTLEAEGLDEAAEEIRREFLSTDGTEPSESPDASDNRDRPRWGTSMYDDTTPPYFWDTSHTPHRPESPLGEDLDDQADH
ncbi:hypothetical protein ACLQ2N_00030 [Streptomyces sp. DT224]|uniref:hypothetical protein n=1 Tax=Streptomyces sp. DT224 TaxID=3393426 RepID=UPI003CEE74FD